MSTVTSCTFLISGMPVAQTPLSFSGSRLHSRKSSTVALQRKSRHVSGFSANSTKGEHSPKTELPAFNIPPVALVHPVMPPNQPKQERWQVKELDNAVKLWFEVPGLSKEDIVVEIDEDVLVLKKNTMKSDVTGGGSYKAKAGANRDAAGWVDPSKAKVDNTIHDDNVVVYARLLLPAGYSREGVEAELASGVLTVTVAKVKEHARRRINVEITVK